MREADWDRIYFMERVVTKMNSAKKTSRQRPHALYECDVRVQLLRPGPDHCTTDLTRQNKEGGLSFSYTSTRTAILNLQKGIPSKHPSTPGYKRFSPRPLHPPRKDANINTAPYAGPANILADRSIPPFELPGRLPDDAAGRLLESLAQSRANEADIGEYAPASTLGDTSGVIAR